MSIISAPAAVIGSAWDASSVVTPFADGDSDAAGTASVIFNADGTITGFGWTGSTRWWSATPPMTKYVRGKYASKSGAGSVWIFEADPGVGVYSGWKATSGSPYIEAAATGGSLRTLTDVTLQLASDSAGTDILATSDGTMFVRSDNT